MLRRSAILYASQGSVCDGGAGLFILNKVLQMILRILNVSIFKRPGLEDASYLRDVFRLCMTLLVSFREDATAPGVSEQASLRASYSKGLLEKSPPASTVTTTKSKLSMVV